MAAVVVALIAASTAAALCYYELYRHSQQVSWEMAPYCRRSEDGPACVFRWLREHRATIRRVARDRNITPLAIGGVIAFESLEDVDPPQVAPLARYSGPGKVHYKNWRFWEGEPVAKAVEDRGYLPKQTMSSRRDLLATAHGAISYIGSILTVYADIASKRGYDVRCNPALLATFYSAWDFSSESRLLEKHPRTLRPNDIGQWVSVEQKYLGNAIGDSSSKCFRDP